MFPFHFSLSRNFSSVSDAIVICLPRGENGRFQQLIAKFSARVDRELQYARLGEHNPSHRFIRAFLSTKRAHKFGKLFFNRNNKVTI